MNIPITYMNPNLSFRVFYFKIGSAIHFENTSIHQKTTASYSDKAAYSQEKVSMYQVSFSEQTFLWCK